MLLPLLILAIQRAVPVVQTPPESPAAQTADRPAPMAAEEEDVVVTGYRLRPDIATTVVPPADGGTLGIRQGFEWSGMLARCAARNRLSGLKWLRATVDGEFQTTRQLVAQDRLRRIYTTCSENPEWINRNTRPPALSRTSGSARDPGNDAGAADGSNAADVAPLGHSIYDRGAFIIEAMKKFAPDLTLTRAQTLDPAVQDRFNRREVPRNRFRFPADYRYFEIAVCMVRVEPKLSVQLAMSEGPARFGDTQAALIDRARVCVGNARKVTIDPTEFRIYIADAVYRWAVAAKGVDSLIPADS